MFGRNDDVIFPNNGLQNGADAVALYTGDASDIPTTASATAANLLDAVVCGTSDGDEMSLLAILTPGRPQLDEAGGGNKIGGAS